MSETNHSVVTVTLIIKCPASEAVKIAQDALLTALNEWFTMDITEKPPYSQGSLLFYTFGIPKSHGPADKLRKEEF